MIFPNYEYKELNNSNKSKWVDEWNVMVNKAHAYCESLKNVYEFIGKCADSDLPSFHPYWKIQSKINTISLLQTTLESASKTKGFIDHNPSHSIVGNARAQYRREIDFANELASKL